MILTIFLCIKQALISKYLFHILFISYSYLFHSLIHVPTQNADIALINSTKKNKKVSAYCCTFSKTRFFNLAEVFALF